VLKVQQERRIRSPEAAPLAPQQPPNHHVAYICECGEKLMFTRDEVSTKEARTLRCACGRTIVIERGILYSTGHPRSDSHKRSA
jgi:hypothetical protein